MNKKNKIWTQLWGSQIIVFYICGDRAFKDGIQSPSTRNKCYYFSAQSLVTETLKKTIKI